MRIKKTLLPLLGLGAFACTANAIEVNYGEALQKSIYFYEAQQAGEIPSWNRTEWRGDSTLEDGSDVGVDLTGGWYDAGDHVKFGFPMAASATMLAWGVVEYPQAYTQSNQMEHIKNNLRFVADYFMSAHPEPNVLYGQVGTGSDDHSWWGPAEVVHLTSRAASDRPSYKITASCPGSDLAGETAAALASISMIFATEDPSYANELIRHATELYDFAKNYQGKYSECITDATAFYNSWSGYNDELVWSAIWMYRATGESDYLDAAIADYANLNTEPQSTTKSYKWTHAWDDKGYGSYVLLAKLTGGAEYRADAERWLDYWSTGYQGERISYTAGGLAQLDTWGANRYAANTSFIALVYSDFLKTVEPANSRVTDYYNFALSQMEYIMGDNPMGIPYQIGMAEGGPKNPHHRTAHGTWADSLTVPAESRHLLVGALVGGPGSGDSYEDDRGDYIANEVATDYNAGFTSALARMYLDFGGAPIPESQFPAAETRDLEFYVEAKVNSEGSRHMEIAARVHNHTAWPARNGANLKFRYWVDLTEEMSLGYSASDITVSAAYSQASSVSDLQVWGDGSDNIYYTEVSFAGVDIFPGGQSDSNKEVQFRLSLPTTSNDPDWVNEGDPSWGDYGSAYETAPKIALYDGAELVWGEEPSPACGGETGINCVPVASDVSVSTSYETPVNIDLLATDEDGSIASSIIVSPPSNGSLMGSGLNLVYSPDSGFFGSDSFEYRVSDNEAAVSELATVTVSVDAPIVPAVAISSPAENSDIVIATEFTLSYSVSYAAAVRVSVNGVVIAANHTATSIVLNAPSSVGPFTVQLDALDSEGNELGALASSTFNAVEPPPNTAPVACFTLLDSPIVTGSSASFSASCSNDDDGDALSYSWDFGDGAEATGSTASHIYVIEGSYEVTLTVSDGEDSDSTTMNILVEDLPANRVTCVIGNADIWNTGYVLNNIAVTNEGTETISSWSVTIPFAETPVITGSWNANIEVVGNNVVASGNNSIAPGQYANFGFQGSHSGNFTAPECIGSEDSENANPTADFNASTSNLVVSFDASISSDPDGDVLSYSWDFGDGSSGTGVSVNHSYQSADTYTVTLSVNDGRGGNDTYSSSVSVEAGPNQAPVADFEYATRGLSANFDASASSDLEGDGLTYSWDFGDGYVDTGVTSSHDYSVPGMYTVSLEVDDGQGGSDSIIKQVSVDELVVGSHCEYILENYWSTGFTAVIRITNNGTSSINGWEVSWAYSDGSEQSASWNANVSGSNPYTATPLSWNADIAPGDSVEFGVQGSLGSAGQVPIVPALTGAVCN